MATARRADQPDRRTVAADLAARRRAAGTDIKVRPGEMAAWLVVDLKSVARWRQRGLGDPTLTPGGHGRFSYDAVVAHLKATAEPAGSWS